MKRAENRMSWSGCEKSDRSGAGVKNPWNGNGAMSRLNWPLKFCSMPMLLNLRNAVQSAKSKINYQSELEVCCKNLNTIRMILTKNRGQVEGLRLIPVN